MLEINELLAATKGKLLQGKRSALVKGISIDSRSIRPGEAFVAIKGNNFDGHNFLAQAVEKGAGAVVASCVMRHASCVKIPVIQVKDTTRALGDIGRFQREKYGLPLIAVTGSNGKTTTKDITAWLFAEDFCVLKNPGTKNNHIGLPMALSGLNSAHRLAVVEIGTNHPGEVAYLSRIAGPNIGIITNIGCAHLEYFKDLAGVLKEKSALFVSLRAPRIAVLNADDCSLRQYISREDKKIRVFSFGIKNKADFRASGIESRNGKTEFYLNKKNKCSLNTPGAFNVYNALAAAAVARLMGLGYRRIAEQMSSFVFPPGRLNLVRINNIRFIDDTYNSNPLSLKSSLEALAGLRVAGKKILVMGDMLELGKGGEEFHCRAGADAAKTCDVLVAVGELSRLAADGARQNGIPASHIFTCASAAEARELLCKKILPGRDDIVLVKGSRAM
ncbi:MAG: UDP-N-acetylmuramoyl-tripeptide--D-alanyl-D-alanine ligase [Candidatus Omnitrophota bacterium]|nr:UDP-N-acetylmuramoyl-tripeptide--D-alanyl-D-alanine ligase [Candidatus Omnitrophota bacterium]